MTIDEAKMAIKLDMQVAFRGHVFQRVNHIMLCYERKERGFRFYLSVPDSRTTTTYAIPMNEAQLVPIED